jgi:hypothetical protein
MSNLRKDFNEKLDSFILDFGKLDQALSQSTGSFFPAHPDQHKLRQKKLLKLKNPKSSKAKPSSLKTGKNSKRLWRLNPLDQVPLESCFGLVGHEQQ